MNLFPVNEEKYIFFFQLPETPNEWKLVASEFEARWNFTHCVGAMDGKHIVIRPPKHSGSLYFNYKQFFSIVLFALVDADYSFLMVDIGTNGRISDGGVLKQSQFGKALLAKTLNFPDREPLRGRNQDQPFVITADDAFALHDGKRDEAVC
jgi:hypothetical protein